MQRYIAFGDIHGHADELKRLFNKIVFQADDIIVFLGDYIDRGPKNKEVLDFLMNLPVKNNAVFLRGNHEDMLLKSQEFHNFNVCWLQNGGYETLRDFGVKTSSEIPEEYMNWLGKTELFYQPNNASLLFVHAGIDPEFPLSHQTEMDLMWIRDKFLNSTKDFGLVVVHGHTPVINKIDVRSNRINVDTGSCFGGSVSAVVLNSKGNVLEKYYEKC